MNAKQYTLVWINWFPLPLLIGVLLFSNVYTQECSYTAQIKATDTQAEAQSLQVTIGQKGLPVSISEIQKDHKTFYRIQIQHIKDSTTARILGNALGFPQAWIFKDPKGEARNSCIAISADTVVSILQSTPSYYASKNRTYVALYQKHFGTEASTLPSSMLVYTIHAAKPFEVNDLTGFMPTDSSILFGRTLLLERSSSGEFKLGNVLKEKLVHLGVSSEPGHYTLSYFGDHTELRLNLLSELMIPSLQLVHTSKAGFDYGSISKENVLLGGAMEQRTVGSELEIKLPQNETKWLVLQDGIVLISSGKEQDSIHIYRLIVEGAL